MASWAVNLSLTKKKYNFVLNLCDHTRMWEKNLVKTEKLHLTAQVKAKMKILSGVE